MPLPPSMHLDLSCNLREYHVEHEVCHCESKYKVERLTTSIQDQWFAAFKVACKFAEVGSKTNCCEAEAEEPTAEYFREAADYTMVDHRKACVGTKAGVDG